MVLEQNGEKALERAEHRAVQHDRGAFLAVLVDVIGAEPPRHVEVDLQCAALPVAADGIAQDELELGTVEGPLARIQGVFDARGARGASCSASSARSHTASLPTRLAGRSAYLMRTSSKPKSR